MLQADEIFTFAGGKAKPTWIFAAIEVWSRLWSSTVVGRRSYRNTLALFRDVSNRMHFERILIGDYPVCVRRSSHADRYRGCADAFSGVATLDDGSTRIATSNKLEET